MASIGVPGHTGITPGINKYTKTEGQTSVLYYFPQDNFLFTLP